MHVLSKYYLHGHPGGAYAQSYPHEIVERDRRVEVV